MLHHIAIEVLIGGVYILPQLSLGYFTFLILAELVFGSDPAVEGAHIEDLEDDIQDDQQGKEGARCDEEEYSAKEQCPDYQCNDGQELYEGNDDDEARNRVLSADVLRPARLLLALAKEGNQAAEESRYEERERQDADIIDGEEDAGSAVVVCLPAFGAARNADALMHV